MAEALQRMADAADDALLRIGERAVEVEQDVHEFF